MKRFTATALTLIILALSLCLTAFAETSISYDAIYSANDKTVKVTVTILGAEGLSDGDIRLAYDDSKYEYVDSEALADDTVMLFSGKAIDEDGLCTCSFMSMEEVQKNILDANGNLPLVSFTFTTLTDKFDAGDFLLYCDSLTVAGEDVKTAPKGNVELLSEHETGGVTAAPDGKGSGSTASKEENKESNKKLVVIIAIIVVGAAAIALVLVFGRKKKTDEADTKVETGANTNDKTNE